MAKIFVIGDREKSEWVSVFDAEQKQMAFKNDLAAAKEFAALDEAKAALAKMQETGYFFDLQVYLKEADGKAYAAFERDSFHV